MSDIISLWLFKSHKALTAQASQLISQFPKEDNGDTWRELVWLLVDVTQISAG